MHLTASPPLRKFLYYWFPVWLYCLIIFLQSSFPSYRHVPVFDYSDKLLHVGAYAVLATLFFRALKAGNTARKAALTIVLSIVFTTLYGISDEIHQYFVPTRTADIQDMAANFIGSIIGAIVAAVFFRGETLDNESGKP